MRKIVLLALPLLLARLLLAGDSAEFAAWVGNEYRVRPNITYKVASNAEQALDVYFRRDTSTPRPTVIYIHGGGWVGGSKEASALRIAPYLEMGFNVVNVEYRLGRAARAPAAVEDCRCALRWVIRNAESYGIDPERLVVTGRSAGGHLSLTTGMLSVSAGFDAECISQVSPKVAAVVNYYGITDVADLMAGKPNEKSYTVSWLGSQRDRKEIADSVSPIHHVRKNLPPILTIHGDADKIVPYSHAVELHKRLDEAGAQNELLTIPGGGHGGFSRQEVAKIDSTIRAFLGEHGLMPD